MTLISSKVTISLLIIVFIMLSCFAVRWARISGFSPLHVAPVRYETARDVVTAYLDALHHRDYNGVHSLVYYQYDAKSDIENRLTRFGGIRADTARVDMKTDISQDILSVSIVVLSEDNSEVRWVENLFWRDDRWWFVLGGVDKGEIPKSSIRH